LTSNRKAGAAHRPRVKTPSGGAFQDIFDAGAGRLAYEPGLVRAPGAIIRGAWDSMCTDEERDGCLIR